MLPFLLAISIIIGYAAALWWLLKGESKQSLLIILILCVASLNLKLAFTEDYPAGLSEDEPKRLECSIQALKRGDLFSPSCTGPPYLLSTLFQAPLAYVVGPNRWAIRSYSIVTSILSVAAAFATARALGLSLLPSFAAGVLISVLPWALFFGRIDLGGELIFHELLLLAALIHLMRGRAAITSTLVAAFALCLLLYDYTAGRAMLAMPAVAFLLTPGWKRFYCLLIIAIALVGWLPHLRSNPSHAVQRQLERVDGGYHSDPVTTLKERSQKTFRTFHRPTAWNGWFTVQAAAMHPPLILVFALLGLFGPPKRSLFLLAGLLIGLAPAILSTGKYISAHRMIMAFPFIVISVCCAFERIRQPQLRNVTTALVCIIATLQSGCFYFSDSFWRPKARAQFDADRSALVEELPPQPHPRFVLMHQLGYFFLPRALFDSDAKHLNANNFMPPRQGPVIFGFTKEAAALRPFYETLVGPRRIKRYGKAFTVAFEKHNWAYVSKHGWQYEARCGATVKRVPVPTLAFFHMTADKLSCPRQSTTHTWRGRWLGKRSSLTLKFSREGSVRTSSGLIRKGSGKKARVNFSVASGEEIEIRVTTPPGEPKVTAVLYEHFRERLRIPQWDSVDPLEEVPSIEAFSKVGT